MLNLNTAPVFKIIPSCLIIVTSAQQSGGSQQSLWWHNCFHEFSKRHWCKLLEAKREAGRPPSPVEKRHIRLTSGGGSLSNWGKLMSRTDALQFLTVIFAWLFPGVGTYWAVALLFITREIPIWEWKSKSEEGYLHRCSLYTHNQRAPKKTEIFKQYFLHSPNSKSFWELISDKGYKAGVLFMAAFHCQVFDYIRALWLLVAESSQKMKNACQAMQSVLRGALLYLNMTEKKYFGGCITFVSMRKKVWKREDLPS